MTTLNLCTVTGSVADILGNVEIANAVLLVTMPAPFFYGTILIQPSVKQASVDESGNFSIDLVQTATHTPTQNYVFVLVYTTDSGVQQSILLGSGVVPNANSAALSSFLTIGPLS